MAGFGFGLGIGLLGNGALSGVAFIPTPLVELDFKNGVYKLGGVETALSALVTEHGTMTVTPGEGVRGDGASYYQFDSNIWNDAEGAVLVETVDEGTTAKETVFSVSTGSGATRFRFELFNVDTSADQPQLTLVYNNGSAGTTVAQNQFGDPVVNSRSFMAAYKSGETCKGACGGALTSPLGSNAYEIPVSGLKGSQGVIEIGRRAAFGDQNIQDTLIERIVIFGAGGYSLNHVALTNKDTDNLWFAIGDSFVTSAQFTDEGTNSLREVRIDDGWSAIAYDGVPSSTLSDQAARFDALPQYYGRKLIILDGGMDSTPSQANDAIDAMAAHLSGEDWLWIEPNPGSDAASSAATAIKVADVLDHIHTNYGYGHYVPTLAALQAANDASAQDLTDYTDDIVPTSLRSDTIHPNDDGRLIINGRIRHRIVNGVNPLEELYPFHTLAAAFDQGLYSINGVLVSLETMMTAVGTPVITPGEGVRFDASSYFDLNNVSTHWNDEQGTVLIEAEDEGATSNETLFSAVKGAGALTTRAEVTFKGADDKFLLVNQYCDGSASNVVSQNDVGATPSGTARKALYSYEDGDYDKGVAAGSSSVVYPVGGLNTYATPASGYRITESGVVNLGRRASFADQYAENHVLKRFVYSGLRLPENRHLIYGA